MTSLSPSDVLRSPRTAALEARDHLKAMTLLDEDETRTLLTTLWSTGRVRWKLKLVMFTYLIYAIDYIFIDLLMRMHVSKKFAAAVELLSKTEILVHRSCCQMSESRCVLADIALSFIQSSYLLDFDFSPFYLTL